MLSSAVEGERRVVSAGVVLKKRVVYSQALSWDCMDWKLTFNELAAVDLTGGDFEGHDMVLEK